MSEFDRKTVKSKEINRLRSEDAEIGEKVDFAWLILRQFDQISRMKLVDLMEGGNGVLHFSAVQSLTDVLYGIMDDNFRVGLAKIEAQYDAVVKECLDYNADLDKKYGIGTWARDDYLSKYPDYYAFARLYLKEDISLIQRKGFGLTEISTEAF